MFASEIKKNWIGMGLGILEHANRDHALSPLIYSGRGYPLHLYYQYKGEKNVYTVVFYYVGVFHYDEWHTKYPVNFPGWDTLKMNYLLTWFGKRPLWYGTVRGHNIGYIWLESYGGAKQLYADIDKIIEMFQSYDGIFIDVRNNGGGNSDNANYIAGRFADNQYVYDVYGYVRWRNGPRHSDFGDYISHTIMPDGSKQYEKPVAVLTNHKSFSAAEDFVLAMKCFPQVSVVGDTTGGGAGYAIFRGLPNGWVYRVPRWIAYDRNKVSYEGIGIAPDISVWITEADFIAGKDTILETAIEVINQKSAE